MSLRARSRSQGGFSLLEMMVAIAILALSLGALYQATSGATRNVRGDEKYAFGVELAQSLLANYAVVPLGGISKQGETAGYCRVRKRVPRGIEKALVPIIRDELIGYGARHEVPC